jgi:hypothetical protein
MGGEYRDVVIKRADLEGNTLRKHMIDFYIKVVPLRLGKNSSETYKYDIAFYDSKQLIHLRDSRMVRGVISNQSMDYYYFSRLNDKYDYEIALGSISGGSPNLVVSFDPDN